MTWRRAGGMRYGARVLRAIFQRWELKLLSLAIALTLWLFVVGGERGEVMLAARVEYLNVPSGLVLEGTPRDTVDVQVQGPRPAIRRLTAADVRVQVSLLRLGPGNATVPLGPDQVQAPPDVTVLRVHPSRVRLTLEPVATGEVLVVPRLTGSPEPGYVVARVSVTPPTVQVRGPQSVVAGHQAVQTSPVDISGATTSITRRTELLPAPGTMRLTGTRSVDVTVEIKERRDLPAGGPGR